MPWIWNERLPISMASMSSFMVILLSFFGLTSVAGEREASIS
jgi:hypothetical protein